MWVCVRACVCSWQYGFDKVYYRSLSEETQNKAQRYISLFSCKCTSMLLIYGKETVCKHVTKRPVPSVMKT